MEKRLEDNEQRLEYVIQGANLGYWDWNYSSNGHVVNDTWLSFLGLQRKDIKNDIADWTDLIHPDDKALVQSTIEKTLQDFKPYVIEFRMKHHDGHWVWIEGSGAVVEKDDKLHQALRLVGTHRDISDRKRVEEEIIFLALNDPLTKLPNRILLKRKFDASLAAHIAYEQLAFLFLDLDAFKTINDLYGHTIGDKIIQDVALRLSRKIGINDIISRVGGDEFVILTHDVVSVETLCKNVLMCMHEAFYVEAQPITLSVSIGVVLYPQDGNTFEELFKYADIAMYAAKNSGKNGYKFYHKSMSEQLCESAALENSIKRGLSNDEFCLYYQPQINLNTGKVIGVEALVRWMSPHVGLIFPNDFIPQAEENRLIIPLGEIIFRKALEQSKIWESSGVFDGTMAINISAVQIEEENFVAKIEAIRHIVDINASKIELEITESFLMKDPFYAAETLQKLKTIGYKISIDDFGTGYSSLAYLKQLPLHKLKIDRTFIKDLSSDKDDRAIVRAIIALAKALELEVLAEGVETEEQKVFLLDNWCDTAQGYLFARPMSIKVFEDFLRQN
ncbi:MAG: EAL domain-containing protein [Sulfurospirillaceae bacterium]|nr:EAL domain-containing protein [Sulfurospirillaceae bacterium]MDD2825782.1 EAL domain-containing protein [Sulfurospirillaceae bacterium]